MPYQENDHNEGLVLIGAVCIVLAFIIGLFFSALDSKAVTVSATVKPNKCNQCLSVCEELNK